MVERGRRRFFAAVAGLAAIGGAAFSWWRFGADALDDAQRIDGLWGRRFDTPAGASLELKSFQGRPLLLNFWATWCPPCVEEMPMLDAFHKQRAKQGLQVVGLAIDQPAAVLRFLARTPVSYPIGLAGFEGTQLTRDLGNAAGGLPFTVLLDSAGRIRERKLGQLQPEDLERWATAA